MLLLELSPVSSSCSALAFAQERNPWALSERGLGKLCNRCGDVLEAVGGICDPRSSEAEMLRSFLVSKYDITENDFVAIRTAQTHLSQQMFFAWKFARTDEVLMEMVYQHRVLGFSEEDSSVDSNAMKPGRADRAAEDVSCMPSDRNGREQYREHDLWSDSSATTGSSQVGRAKRKRDDDKWCSSAWPAPNCSSVTTDFFENESWNCNSSYGALGKRDEDNWHSYA